MQDYPGADTPPVIPHPDAVRARLAALLTEAAVLKRQLKVSEKAARANERLRRQLAAGRGAGNAV
jgi:hypothetical protein